MSNKSEIAEQVISLPKGGGALHEIKSVFRDKKKDGSLECENIPGTILADLQDIRSLHQNTFYRWQQKKRKRHLKLATIQSKVR